MKKGQKGLPTNHKIILNGKTYSEDYLFEPVHGDLEYDFYNLAFAAIVEWKKKTRKGTQGVKNTNACAVSVCKNF